MKGRLTNWDHSQALIVRRLKVDLLKDSSPRMKIRREVASEPMGLPVCCDIGGCLIISEEGKVLGFDFALDKGDEKIPEDFDSEEWLKHAFERGAQRYPDLFSKLQFEIFA